MTPGKLAFANAELAQVIARALCPDAQRISLVDHGYDNLVVLIDQNYALRFPRNSSALVRSHYEKQILAKLTDIKEVAIPKVLGEHANPPYLVTSFLAGQHVNVNDIRSWPDLRHAELGEHTARFAFQMHSTLSVEEVRQLRSVELDKQHEEPWRDYFKRTIGLDVLTHEQGAIAQQHYREWQGLNTNSELVLHDDLHTENMLFQNDRLTGVLDFGDTNIGSPEQELRPLYRINNTVLTSAVKTYEQLSGLRLNVRAIQVWAIVQELGAYSDRLATNQINHPSFLRASSNLNRWFSTDIWGKELIRNVTSGK
jgi:aminoglycoside 2''-phosphotransferase